MKRFILLALIAILISCQEQNNKHESKYQSKVSYFYPISDTTRIYCYRNITNGLSEEFHRVFTVSDSMKHLIVERYSSDKRFLEAYNYSIETKDVLEHIVVNKNLENEIAVINSNHLFPVNQNRTYIFSSDFGGTKDSTIFRKEITRTFNNTKQLDYLGFKNLKTFIFNDSITQHYIDFYNKNSKMAQVKGSILFAEGIGPVEWYDTQKKIHFKLEKIISQKEWIRLMQF